jgi:hypothetical protein
MNIPHDERHGFFLAAIVANIAFKAHDPEISPSCGKIGLGNLANCGFGTHWIIIDVASCIFGSSGLPHFT